MEISSLFSRDNNASMLCRLGWRTVSTSKSSRLFGDEQSGESGVSLIRHWTIAIEEGGIIVVRSTDNGNAFLTSKWIWTSMKFGECKSGGPELGGSVEKRINLLVSKIFTDDPVKSRHDKIGDLEVQQVVCCFAVFQLECYLEKYMP